MVDPMKVDRVRTGPDGEIVWERDVELTPPGPDAFDDAQGNPGLDVAVATVRTRNRIVLYMDENAADKKLGPTWRQLQGQKVRWQIADGEWKLVTEPA
jgi:hypothetical protein